MVYREKNLTDSHGCMYLTFESLIEMNNIVNGSNNITIRKVNVKLFGFDKMYMDKELIEGKLYQIIHWNNDKKLHLPSFIQCS